MNKIKAYAKINIGLNILKFNKKYQKHQLKSIFCLVSQYYDEINIKVSKTNSIKYIDQKNKTIKIENDLVSKTLEFMKNRYHIKDSFSIKIKKQIPTQSGLGGASSDAAAIINYFKDKYQLKFNRNFYFDVAVNLGSDIVFFITKYRLAIVSGFGEKVKSIKKDLPYFKIISNNFTCSTKQIYESFKLNQIRNKNDFRRIIKNLNNLNNIKLFNDLQLIAFSINKKLLKFYNNLDGKDNILLTGSGSFFVDFNVKKGKKWK